MVSTARSMAVSVALRARQSQTMAALPGTIIVDVNFLVRISVFIPDRPEAKHGQNSDTSLAQLVEALRAAVSPREQQTGEALSERADHLHQKPEN